MQTLVLLYQAGRAFVDGDPLHTTPGEDPAQALVQYAVARAAREGELLAHVMDDAGTDIWLQISSDGQITQVPEPTKPARIQAQPTPSNLSSWSAGTSTAAEPTPKASKARADGIDRRVLIGGLAGLAVLAVGGGIWAMSDDDSSSSEPSASSGILGQNAYPPGQYPPQGWNQQKADWSVANVMGTAFTPGIRGHLLALVTADPGSGLLRLHVKDTDSGQDHWVSPLNVGEQVNGGPYFVKRDQLYVLLWTQERFMMFDAQSGKVVLSTPDGVPSTAPGCSVLGPWIAKSGQTFLGLTGAHNLQPFTVPSGATAYGSYKDQMIAANEKGEAWKLTAGKLPGTPTKLQGPAGANPGYIVGVTEKYLLTSWGLERNVWVVAYDLATFKQVWTTAYHPGWQASVGTAAISPDQTWAMVGNVRIDLTNGDSNVVATTWNHPSISDQYAWGDDNVYTVTCDRKGQLISHQPGAGGDARLQTFGGANGRLFATGSIANKWTLYAISRA